MPILTRRTGLITGICLALTAFAISANTVPPLVTTLGRTLGIPWDKFSYVFMLQYLALAFVGGIGGHLLGIKGLTARKLTLAGLIILAATLACGTMLDSYLSVVLWIIPLGLAGGLAEIFASIMAARAERGNSSHLMNLTQMFYCLGAIGAPQIVAVALGVGIHWRMVFIITAALAAGAAAIFWHLTGNRRPDDGSINTTDEHGDVTAVSTASGSLFLRLGGALFIYVCVEISTATWVPTYFETLLGVAPAAAAWRMGMFWGGVIVGRFIPLWLPGRLSLWPTLIGAASLFTGALTAMALTRNVSIATALVFLAGIGAGPCWPTVVMVSQRLSRSERFTGQVIAAGGIGAALGPLFSGRLAAIIGLEWFFVIMAAGAAMLLMIFISTCRWHSR